MTDTEVAYQAARYLTSVADLDQLPPDEGIEVAFIGRSNAGKSSALNAITGIKGLARTSKTPGRTQMINFFTLDKSRRLVDLPGYGYAKVPLSVKERWMANIDEYLQIRECLKGLVVIMDIRHPLKEVDVQVINWAADCQVPAHILLSKADKLSTSAQRKVLRDVTDQINMISELLSVQLFSSIDNTGLAEVKQVLNDWFFAE